MSATRIISPEDFIQQDIDSHSVVPVGSPITLRYESEVLGNATNAVGTVQILDSSLITDGYTLTIAGITFTFRSSPKSNEIPSAPASPQTILNSLQYQITNSPALKDLYSVIFNGTQLVIRARETGTAYNFSITQSGAGFGTGTIPAQDGNFAQSKTRYGMQVEVFVDKRTLNNNLFLSQSVIPFGSAEFQQIDTLTKEYGGVNEFEFDISKLLQPFTESQPPLVNNTGVGITVNPLFAKSMICRYAYNVWELWTENGTTYRMPVENCGFNFETSVVKKTLWAVRSSERRWYDFEKTYVAYYQKWRFKKWLNDTIELVPVYFLTHQPRRKVIRRDALEFLYFIFDRPVQNNDQLQVQVTYEFEDCTTEVQTSTIINYPPSNEWGFVGYIEVSPRVWDLSAKETLYGEKIRAYFVELRLLIGGNPNDTYQYSVNQAYELYNEEEYTDYVPTLCFLNPLGGYDTFTPRGVVSKSLDNQQETYARTLQHRTKDIGGGEQYTDYSKLTETGVYNSETKVRYSFVSGWMDKDHYDWLRDLIQSTDVYIIDQSLERETRDISTFLPRKVIRSNFEWSRRSDADEYGLTIEVELVLNPNNISS